MQPSKQSRSLGDYKSKISMLANTRLRHGPGPKTNSHVDYMVSPERTQNFNRQSMKVNSGLNFGSAQYDGEDVSSAFSAVPPLAIDFSALIVPHAMASNLPVPVTHMVKRLLTPPRHAFVHGVLSINWVMGVVGPEHFEFRESDGRCVLSSKSELRRRGKLGLPAVYHEWLCGDDLDGSANEEGMLLTPEFFEKEV